MEVRQNETFMWGQLCHPTAARAVAAIRCVPLSEASTGVCVQSRKVGEGTQNKGAARTFTVRRRGVAAESSGSPGVCAHPGMSAAQFEASSTRLASTGANAVCTEAWAMAAWKACSEAADESIRQSASLLALNQTAPTTRGLARIRA